MRSPAPATRRPTEDASAPTVELCLLGAPAVAVAGRRIALSAKDAALLCLAARAGPIRADRVGALLWPASTARQADTSLRQRLYRLRRDAGVPLVSGGTMLELAPHVQTDLATRLAQLAHDEQAPTGDLLGDLDFDALPELADWLHAQRRDWRASCGDALAAAAAQCEHDGALARGLVYAQRLVEHDPLAEHAQRRLMRLHYLRGDRASAIAAFERFEQRLKDELGTRPSAETIELLATIEGAVATVPARRATVPASLLRPPRLIGRARELAALQHAWSNRRAFLLVGEAGIGKSRLLRELAGALPRAGIAAAPATDESMVATQVHRGDDEASVAMQAPSGDDEGIVATQARPGDAGIAYAVLARLLRAVLAAHPVVEVPRSETLALVLPELGHAVALAGEAQRLLLQRAVTATLADAVSRGLRALIVDDLHFADDASLELLQSLAQSPSLAELQWGFAMRPVEPASGAARLRSALEDAGRIEATLVDPLDLEELSALVASLGLPELDAVRLAPALLKHTGGNPMFALETLKDLVLQGGATGIGKGARLPQPVSVGALVERRLAQLSGEALRLARVAALAGPDFNAELAVAVLEAHPLDIAEPWRELETAQVFRDGAFAHDIVFDATRASVPEPIAQLLHRRIATQLEARRALPDSIAPHWAGAAEWQRAGTTYVAAAERAQRASQRGHEVECWRLAAAAFDRAGDADAAFDARCDSIHATIVVHGVTHATAVIDALVAAAHSERQRAAALTAKATAALMAADHTAGIAAAVQAAELARAFDSPWPGFEAARLHAVGLAQAGRASDALALIEP
jgi:DNA-binding SARP family transcriptional activator